MTPKPRSYLSAGRATGPRIDDAEADLPVVWEARRARYSDYRRPHLALGPLGYALCHLDRPDVVWVLDVGRVRSLYSLAVRQARPRARQGREQERRGE